MVKIYSDYKIDPVPIVNPNDIISGKLYIYSQVKKPKKISSVFGRLIESYEIFKMNWSGLGGDWEKKTSNLDKWILARNLSISTGETKEIEFKIKLPSTWSPKMHNNTKDWHMALEFVSNVGIFSVKSYCVLPVYGTERPPSINVIHPSDPSHVQTQNVVVNINGDLLKNKEEVVETKFCSFCGKKIKKQAIYCEHCGAQQ